MEETIQGDKKKITHVVMIPSPGMGHVIPSLELAKLLVSSHGLHVTLFVPTTTTHSSSKLLSDNSLSLLQDLHIINLPPFDDTSNGLAQINGDVIQASLPTIRSIIQGLDRRPTVLITDLFATDAFGLADDLNMAKYMFSPSNVAQLVLINTFLGYELEDNSVESVRIPGYRTIPINDLGEGFMDRKIHGFVHIAKHARRVADVTGILTNSFADLEDRIIQALKDDNVIHEKNPIPPVHLVGPIIKSSLEESNSECLTWLDSQPSNSVLFVSFGSCGTLSADQLTEFAWGLELSQQRFIWVVRKPVDMATGSGSLDDPSEYLPEGFMTRTKGRGLVVSKWAPQVEILSHVAVGGFLSHCGWNSTLESIVNGVPMIPWPLFADQHLNALMVDDYFGVGIRSPIQSGVRVVDREEIERVVRMVMEGEEGKALRARAKELKTSASRALSKGGSSYNSLARVVEKFKSY